MARSGVTNSHRNMSGMCQDRSSRLQDIEKGLKFIELTLPYPGTQEQYEVFIQDLVRNLFREGNYLFWEGEWARSIEQYTEALNVSDYAESEEIVIPQEIKEKLYGNRAEAYLNIGLYDQVLNDCEAALLLNGNNYRAQYRKARSLKEMGRYQEAYDVAAKCSMAVPQDSKVIDLTQMLAKMLGLKIRKAYIRGKQPVSNVLSGSSMSGATHDKNVSSVEDIETDEGSFAQGTCLSSISIPKEMELKHEPDPVCLDNDILGDDLDELLNTAPEEPSMVIPTVTDPLPLPNFSTTTSSMVSSLHQFQAPLMTPPYTVTLPAPYQIPSPSVYSLGMDSFHSQLDSLDSLSISDSGFGQPPFMIRKLDLPNISPIGMPFGIPDAGLYAQNVLPQVDFFKNPLADTHEFKQACSLCYAKTGPGVLDYTYHPDDHKCKQDFLIGRIKHTEKPVWKLIRPRPKNQYMGPYYVCKDVDSGAGCKYLGHCTFAYCQEEIDVWTQERMGFISRELLCDPYGPKAKISLTVSKILQEHQGIFIFLCDVCFDHKPRKICRPGICTHQVRQHGSELNRCLVHFLKDVTLKYSKIRQYNSQYQMDLCRHAIRYGCQREDCCFFAHSLIELKVWIMQQEQGITHESIVLESKKYIESGSQAQALPAVSKKFGPPNLKMQFVCGQCWRNGQVSEPDKSKKYCSTKARHAWSKDRQVVLVSSTERKKWISVRSLPTRKPAPTQFELCLHVSSGKKCQYIGNCTFAHSLEEKDLWTFMKENNITDFEHLYDLWLKSQKQDYCEESSSGAAKENGKQIHMPTDYAEEVTGYHCWLCGKNCNSEKQWQQHITSEKHKDRMFNSEDDQNGWQYRFPTGTFKVCERFLKGTCTEGEQCNLAHGMEELKEWNDRREFLLMKVAKARSDHLISPNDNDFGKYSFLLIP